MSVSHPVPNDKLYLELVKYGKDEQQRRKESPILVSGDDVAKLLETNQGVYMVDPRMGFNNRTHRLFVSKHVPTEAEDNQMWKTLGHRHTVEAVIHWLAGKGYSIVDGIRYDWEAGDFICVPIFAWHRHVNLGDEPAIHVASTTALFTWGLERRCTKTNAIRNIGSMRKRVKMRSIRS